MAAFSAFGHFEGIGWQDDEKLSAKWIGLCREMLDNLGPVFDYRWSDSLSHIRTKVTSAQGAGICTIFVDDQTASSILLMSGREASADREIAEMYSESLRRSLARNLLGEEAGSFSEIQSIMDRPLMVVVPFPVSGMSEQDQDLVRELAWHLAAAFLKESR